MYNEHLILYFHYNLCGFYVTVLPKGRKKELMYWIGSNPSDKVTCMFVCIQKDWRCELKLCMTFQREIRVIKFKLSRPVTLLLCTCAIGWSWYCRPVFFTTLYCTQHGCAKKETTVWEAIQMIVCTWTIFADDVSVIPNLKTQRISNWLNWLSDV